MILLRAVIYYSKRIQSKIRKANMLKSPPANAGYADLIPGSRIFPGEGNGNPFQYSCLGNPMDKRSLLGYSPWVGKKLDST